MPNTYKYSSLKEVNEDRDEKYHHIFGVVKYLGEQGVFLKDEKFDSLKIDFTSKCLHALPKIKPGDVIRIHRVCSHSQYSKICLKISDIIIFPSFKDKDLPKYKTRYTAVNPTFEKFDKKRKEELEKWFSRELLKNSLKDIGPWTRWTDIIVQVVKIIDVSPNRVVVIVRDGTQSVLKFNTFITSDNCLNDETVSINVWDRHTCKAKSLEIGSLIVIFNLENKQVNREKYELHLRGGSHFGKCIRKVHFNSFAGIEFKKRFGSKADFEAPARFLNQTNPKPSSSKINDHENNHQVNYNHLNTACTTTTTSVHTTTITVNNESEVKSEKVNENEKPKNGINIETDVVIKSSNDSAMSTSQPRTSKRRKTKKNSQLQFPVFLDIEIPEPSMNIDQYLKLNSDSMCSIVARVVNYLPFSENVTDFIRILCTSCKMNKTLFSTFPQSLVQNTDDMVSIYCPECEEKNIQSKSITMFWISLILEDEEKNQLVVTLSKFEMNKILNVTPIDAIRFDHVGSKVITFLKTICPYSKNITNESEGCGLNPLLKWVLLKRLRTNNVIEYKVMTLLRIND